MALVIHCDYKVDMCVNRRDFVRLSELEVRRPIRFWSKRPHLIIQESHQMQPRLKGTVAGPGFQ